MRLTIEHVFVGVTCPAYEDLYFDEPFNIAQGAALQMGRKLLRLDRTPDRILRHICYEPNQDPNSPVKQAFGTSRASFIEELEYDRRTRRGTWRTIPNLFKERVRNTGTIEFSQAPDGCRRVVKGEVKVSLFGFGGIVERMIVDEIQKSYANTFEFTNRWLATRGA